MKITVTMFIRWLVGFRNDCRGAVYIWTAFGIVGLVGFAGLAIDMSYFYVARNQLQTSADSAALAGAVRMSNSVEMQSVLSKHSLNRRDGIRRRNKRAMTAHD